MKNNEKDARAILDRAIENGNGVLRLHPAWVARDFLEPGRRLGLPGKMYRLGKRGAITERWLASTTRADNRFGVPDEGLSFIALNSKEKLTLKDAVETAPLVIMGKEYAATHKGLGRLVKIFDYKYRIPFHFHQMKQHAALVGRNPKEEAYYFPEGAGLGAEPDSYFGVHPSIVANKQYGVFLPYLKDWNSDLILRHSKGYHIVPGDGFHIPAGVLHAPGSALTIELQEDSDVFSMLQALAGGKIISKELLFKDVRIEDRKKCGEEAVLEMIDWEANGDVYFYENRHTPPVAVKGNRQPGGEEHWIFYNTLRFSGKKLLVYPGKKFLSVESGVYSILIWKGEGHLDGNEVVGGSPGMDELLVCHERAVEPMVIENTGTEDLVLFKFFGPDINTRVPMLEKYGEAK